MKKMWNIVLVMLLLAGCGMAETAETVADVWEEPVMAAPSQIHLELPGEALECAMESDTGSLYLGDGYDVMVQTLSGGDLEATIRTLTGFSKEEITVVQTRRDYPKRWEFGQRRGKPATALAGALSSTMGTITTVCPPCWTWTPRRVRLCGAKCSIPLN